MKEAVNALWRILDISYVGYVMDSQRVQGIVMWAMSGQEKYLTDPSDRAALLGESAASSLRQPQPCEPTPPPGTPRTP